MGRRAFVAALLLSSVVVVAQIVLYAVALGAGDDAAGVAPYSVGAARKTDRVVLVVVDSLAVRVADDETMMPGLAALKKRGASGVLWVSRQTGTEQGILGLATGMRTSAFDFLGVFSGKRYPSWTVFDDLHERGENVSFNGNPHWIAMFGDRGAHHHGGHGEAATSFTEDLEALENAEAQLGSASSPALTVVHIGETDLVAHQFGTLDPRYRDAMVRWDRVLYDFVERVLDERTTVIITSDHGNDVWGSHGGSEAIFRRVPVVMVGAGIRPVHGFTMSISDMPATLALLLGARLPGGALAAPATAPIDLAAEQEATILLATYDHLITLAEDAPEPAASEPALLQHRQRLGELRQLAARGQFEVVVAQTRQSTAALVAALEPRRGWSYPGILGAALVFLAAAGLLWAQRSVTLDRWGWALVLLAFSAAEALLFVRVSLVAPIKNFFASAPAHAAAPCFVLGVVAGMTGFLLVRWRDRLLEATGRHSLLAIFAVYLFCSALLPLSTLALLSLCLLMACAHRARLPASTSALIVLVFAGYFSVSTALVLPRLGESALQRYAYGMCSVVLASVWLACGPLRSIGRWPRGALLLLLILAPFGWLDLDMGGAVIVHVVAEIALVLLAALVASRGGSRLCWIAFGLTGAAFLMPSSVTFAAALIGVALVFLVVAWSDLGREAKWLSLASLACAALCAMSKVEDVPSVVALFAVMVWTSDLWAEESPSAGLSAEVSVGLLAAMVVCGRHAFFDLFGRVTSPTVPYGLRHVDVAVGLLGGENLDMARGTALVLLKMILASWVVLGALFIAPVGRRLGRTILLVAGALLLLDVAHTAVRASLSVGALSDRFDGYVVSLFIHTGLFLIVLIGYASLRVLSERPWRRAEASARLVRAPRTCP
jgi:hypothetical protein